MSSTNEKGRRDSLRVHFDPLPLGTYEGIIKRGDPLFDELIDAIGV